VNSAGSFPVKIKKLHIDKTYGKGNLFGLGYEFQAFDDHFTGLAEATF
jgi:hypothetical protein